MGKRKNQADHHKTIVSDDLPNSSEMEVFSEQKSSHQVESSLSPDAHAYLNHSLLQRNPRYCNRKYSRRKTTCHADASTSHTKDDENTILKLSKKHDPDNATVQPEVKEEEHEEEEEEEAAARKQRRIKSSSLSANTVSMDTKKMVCRICGKVLRKKPTNITSSLSLNEPSVVAVLVCGHLYHADCLEQRTGQEEKTDPSCPICMNFISQDDFSGALE